MKAIISLALSAAALISVAGCGTPDGQQGAQSEVKSPIGWCFPGDTYVASTKRTSCVKKGWLSSTKYTKTTWFCRIPNSTSGYTETNWGAKCG